MFNLVKIPKDSPSDIRKLTLFLSRRSGEEFSGMSKPCYRNNLDSWWRDLEHATGITPDVVKEFYDSLPTVILKKIPTSVVDKRQFKHRDIFNDPKTILVLICLIHAFKTRKKEFIRLIYYLFAIRFSWIYPSVGFITRDKRILYSG